LNQSPEVQEVQRLNRDGGEMPLNIEMLSPEVQQPSEHEYSLAGLPEHYKTMSRAI
jgi:hypothetical protein